MVIENRNNGPIGNNTNLRFNKAQVSQKVEVERVGSSSALQNQSTVNNSLNEGFDLNIKNVNQTISQAIGFPKDTETKDPKKKNWWKKPKQWFKKYLPGIVSITTRLSALATAAIYFTGAAMPSVTPAFWLTFACSFFVFFASLVTEGAMANSKSKEVGGATQSSLVQELVRTSKVDHWTELFTTIDGVSTLMTVGGALVAVPTAFVTFVGATMFEPIAIASLSVGIFGLAAKVMKLFFTDSPTNE